MASPLSISRLRLARTKAQTPIKRSGIRMTSTGGRARVQCSCEPHDSSTRGVRHGRRGASHPPRRFCSARRCASTARPSLADGFEHERPRDASVPSLVLARRGARRFRRCAVCRQMPGERPTPLARRCLDPVAHAFYCGAVPRGAERCEPQREPGLCGHPMTRRPLIYRYTGIVRRLCQTDTQVHARDSHP